jgi:hypothetical protein
MKKVHNLEKNLNRGIKSNLISILEHRQKLINKHSFNNMNVLSVSKIYLIFKIYFYLFNIHFFFFYIICDFSELNNWQFVYFYFLFAFLFEFTIFFVENCYYFIKNNYKKIIKYLILLCILFIFIYLFLNWYNSLLS